MTFLSVAPPGDDTRHGRIWSDHICIEYGISMYIYIYIYTYIYIYIYIYHRSWHQDPVLVIWSIITIIAHKLLSIGRLPGLAARWFKYTYRCHNIVGASAIFINRKPWWNSFDRLNLTIILRLVYYSLILEHFSSVREFGLSLNLQQ